MIERYSRPEMVAVWGQANRFALWLAVEQEVARTSARHGLVPEAAAEALSQAKVPDPAQVAALEAETRHDVIAFLTAISAQVGEDAGQWLHFGMTSSDLLDTGLALQLRQAGDLLLGGLDQLLAALQTRAQEHRHTPCAGRSHGIQAESTSFGLKLLGHWAELARGRGRLLVALEEVSVCAISGAVGTFAHLPPVVEEEVASALGLRAEPLSTQIIPRDRHAAFVVALGLLAGGLERLAVEIRHLQRSEVAEVFEPFGKAQKGSSAMPHKRNPILSENVTGLARLVRGGVIPALENIALWHERDISHSSVERVLLPDLCLACDFALHRMAGVVAGLEIDTARMAQNLAASGGVVHSGSVLLALVRAGMEKDSAYRLVQGLALRATEEGTTFADLLRKDAVVSQHLSAQELEKLLGKEAGLEQVDLLFERTLSAFGASSSRSA